MREADTIMTTINVLALLNSWDIHYDLKCVNIFNWWACLYGDWLSFKRAMTTLKDGICEWRDNNNNMFVCY